MKKLWYKILYLFKCRRCEHKDKRDYWLCSLCDFNCCKGDRNE